MQQCEGGGDNTPESKQEGGFWKRVCVRVSVGV